MNSSMNSWGKVEISYIFFLCGRNFDELDHEIRFEKHQQQHRRPKNPFKSNKKINKKALKKREIPISTINPFLFAPTNRQNIIDSVEVFVA